MQYKLEKPVHGTIGTKKYQCNIEWRNGKFIADEPVKSGGEDTGPDPFTLLLSSLASCTLVTLRMYIERKGWDIPSIAVNTNLFQSKQGEELLTFIDRDISFPDAEVSAEQKNRLAEIAQACPVSKILEGNTKVRTYVYHEEEVDKKIKYANDDITVVWKPELCKHSGRCVTQLPQVFDLKAHPWINAKGADTQTIIEQVNKCPTGALSIKNNNDPVF
ncbi:(4Fe-4S)-binding protein [Ferruginibacter sp. SUN106]|uniref:(4Fe-4S)-binding protein n=1 Tax=Ferruginibacter sp. SUN106 TaxID=2978348 RepID=UPI003D36FDD9